jgi:hypothetical protein
LLQQAVLQDLSKAGSLPQPFYMSFNQEDDPMSGFTDEVPGARFSNGYFMLRNRFGMLVETHSWKDYATRVRTTRNTLHAVLNQVAQQGAQWKKLAEEADQQAMRMAGKEVPVSYRTADAYKTIEFRGYAYTRTSRTFPVR